VTRAGTPDLAAAFLAMTAAPGADLREG